MKQREAGEGTLRIVVVEQGEKGVVQGVKEKTKKKKKQKKKKKKRRSDREEGC